MNKAFTVLLMLLTVSIHAQAQNIHKRVLFIGNSYTYFNNMPSLVAQMAASMGDTLTYDVSAPGGSTLLEHTSLPATVDKIRAGGWDVVVLQEKSTLPALPRGEYGYNILDAATRLDSLVHVYNPQAHTYLYMSWGRRKGDTLYCSPSIPYICTYAGMDSAVRSNYEFLADKIGAAIAPVGPVWRRLRSLYPDLELYDADAHHPSLAGSYAAACTFYTTLFVRDLSLSTFTAGLPAAEAAIIRQAAKTVAFDSLDYWRVRYMAWNLPSISSEPADRSVSEGQTVQFTVSASGTGLAYQWQRNGLDISGATSPILSRQASMADNGSRFRAVVTNATGSVTSYAALLTVVTNQLPTAGIITPVAGTLYRGGDVIQFSGTGLEGKDGTLPSSAFSWQLLFHHNTHAHPGPELTISSDGRSGSFLIPTKGETASDVWFRLFLKVTDAQGSSRIDSVDIYPKLVSLTLQSSPQGMVVSLGGRPHKTPYSQMLVSGTVISLSAPASQTKSGAIYNRWGWSPVVTGDSIVVPDFSRTYTALYSTPDWRWVNVSTGAALDRYNKVAFDKVGNNYSVGSFTSASEFRNPNTDEANVSGFAGARTGIISKYSRTGQFQWTLPIVTTGTGSESEAWDVAMHNDSVYVVGYFIGIAQFNSVPGTGGPLANLQSAGGKDVFIAKYAPNGSLLWAHRIGGTANDEARDVNVSRTGKPYIAGNFSNSITFAGRQGITGGVADIVKTSAGGDDAFLLKFTNRGALEWGVTFGGAGNDIAYGIQQDPAQNVYFCGQFSDTANLVPVSGPTLALTSAGGADAFVGQIEFTGRLRWLRRMGGAGDDVARQIASDKSGNTCVTGYFGSASSTFQIDDLGAESATKLNNATQPPNIGDDAFAASYQSGGQFRWARRFGGTSSDQGRAIVSDFSNNFYITGYFTGQANDNGPGSDPYARAALTSANASQDVLLWKLLNNGSTAFAARAGGSNTDQGRGLDTTDAGGAMVVGQYGNNAFFNTIGPIAEVGSSGGFVARYGTPTTGGAARFGDQELVAVSIDIGSVRAYPQPVLRGCLLNLVNTFEEQQPALIYDMQGRQISTHMLAPGKTSIEAPAKAGLYLLRTGTETLRIVVE